MLAPRSRTGRLLRAATALLGATSVAVAQPAAPTNAAPSKRGALVIAHGGGPDWNRRVFETVANAGLSIPAEVSFLMGPEAKARRFQDAVARLTAQGVDEIIVVPLFAPSRSGHVDHVRWLMRLTDSLDHVMHHHLHMADLDCPVSAPPMRLTAALDDSPELIEALVDRARALTPDGREQRALMLVGHGPNLEAEYAFWMNNLRRVAAGVRAGTGFGDVRVGLVRDDAPQAERAEAVNGVRDLVVARSTSPRNAAPVR